MHQTIVFSGPSAVGKTYIANELLKLFPESFEQAKVHTTRQPRKNEILADRAIVSENQFSKMVANGEFIIHGKFGGNWYGFTAESLHPTDRHLLINTWPLLIPEFTKLKHVIIIGMQAPKNNRQVLIERMKKRGDSDEIIEKRLDLIEEDTSDLEKYTFLIKKSGAFFVIENDEIIKQQIIPWLFKKLALQ